jgi:potassium-transporting ATPase KdpC subunit
MQDIKPAILMSIMLTVVCGGIYPAIVTGFARALFPHQANGSLVADRSGTVRGSALIGQPFSEAKYFWPRPSETADFGHNPQASGGSNAGPTNPDYLKTVAERVKGLRESGVTGSVPSDLVQASASGLDPHISPEAALVQIPRVAGARGMSEEALAAIVGSHTEERQLAVFGAPRVNVLALNLALDKLAP